MLRFASALLISTLALVSCGDDTSKSGNQLSEVIETRQLMGTDVTVTLYAPSKESATSALDNAFSVASEIEKTLWTATEGNDITRINAAGAGERITVSRITGDLMKELLLLAETSEGAFDPTRGAMVSQWKTAFSKGELPSKEEIQAARATSGYQLLEVSGAYTSLVKKQAGLKLELGSVARAFAIENMFKSLRVSGILSCRIDCAGISRVGDPPPGAIHWPLSAKHHGGKTETINGFKNAAASTVNSQLLTKQISGQRYSSLLDPQTGLGLTRPVSLTVVASNALLTESLARTLCRLPKNQAQTLAAKFTLQGIFANFDEVE